MNTKSSKDYDYSLVLTNYEKDINIFLSFKITSQDGSSSTVQPEIYRPNIIIPLEIE